MKTFLPSLRRNLLLQVLILATLLPGLTLITVPVQANPSGASVVHGNVAFNGFGTSQLNITQGSQNAIINWQSFSIQSGETTTFIQPNQSAVALNRVVGADPSAIYGALNANGSVIVINPNGIVVGPGGRVDVAGMLTMSTLDIDDQDFLDGGPMRFRGNTGAGIRNYGAISSSNGDVVLLGNFLQNAGTVSAATGTVAFGAGGDIVVNQTASGGKISILAGGVGGENGIENTAAGEINGAAAELKAHGNVYALAIKNDGVVRANGYNFSGGRLTLSGGSRSSVINTGGLYARNSDGSGGRVDISGGRVSIASGTVDASGAAGMQGGSVSVAGEAVNVGNGAGIDVSGVSAGSVSVTGVSNATVDGSVAAVGSDTGGSVDVTADSVLIGSTASIDVSGANLGGSARIGGGFQGNEADIENAESVVVESGALILADSGEGDAGRVTIWADGDTTFEGQVSAQAFGEVGNGGFVEVSGRQDLYFGGLVSTASANGENGTLLLDPTDVIIGNSASTTRTILDTSLVAAWLAGNVVIHTSSTGTEDGNITVERDSILTNDANNGNVAISTANSLAFFANGDIIINDNIQNTGSGNITLFAGWGTDNPGANTFGFDPAAADQDLSLTNATAQPAVSFATVTAGTYGDWGQNGGDIIINGDALGAVSVGSAGGETNAFANQVIIAGGNGNDRFAQLGFGNQRDPLTVTAPAITYAVDGDINVRAKSDVIISAIFGDLDGFPPNDSFAMIGHGGSNNGSQTESQRFGGPADLSGNISVISEGGGIIMRGGNDRSFGQIGHGGQDILGDKDGTITVQGQLLDMRGAVMLNGSADSTNRAGNRIGHGGYESHGNGTSDGYTGDISVVVEGSIYGDVGAEFTNGNGANMVHIGHGGFQSGVVVQNAVLKDAASQNGQAVDQTMGGHSGNIRVEATNGSMNFFAGPRTNAAVHIGNGGYQTHGNHSGDITVIAAGDMIFDRKVHPTVIANDDNSYVMIGNGGNRSGGAFTGDIDVQAGGRFEMHAGNNTSYAQVGHGGFADGGTWNSTNMNARNGYATLSGDINLQAGGNIEMYAGVHDSSAFAMVGHGGTYRIAFGDTASSALETGHHGDITVNSGGDIIFDGKPKAGSALGDVAGSINFVQLGHGGLRSKGDHYGDIDVDAAGDISIIAGVGGWEAYDVSDDRYDLQQTGDGNFAHLGHGGYDSILMRLLDTSAGYMFNGEVGVGIGVLGSADISINAGGNLLLQAPDALGGQRDAQIALDGAIDTDTTTPRPVSPRAFRQHAQIGHGGYGDNDNERRAHEDSVQTGDIMIDVGGSITVRAAQIQQEVRVAGAGDDNRVEYGQAQIGNGGQFVRSNFAGSITVEAGSDISVEAGAAFRDWAKIGHGGYESGVVPNTISSTMMSGDILVRSGGSVSLLGGTGIRTTAGGDNQFQFAQIGHGSGNMGQTVTADITVVAANDVNLTGGVTYRDGYTQIGHGALNNGDGNFTGTIDVTAGDDVNLTSTTGNIVNPGADELVAVRNYAKIGHGDTDNSGFTNSEGVWNGDIYVKAGNDLTSTGGRIGHPDPTSGDGIQRTTTGDTFIAVGRDDPTNLGNGNLTLDANTIITSARFGSSGELRFYLPGVGNVDNFIADGANLNTSFYTTTPFPDGSRSDETIASEFSFTFDSDGLPVGNFGVPPEGDMQLNTFGQYTVFYADLTPALVPDLGGGGGESGPIVIVPFDFSPFFDEDPFVFEANNRSERMLEIDDAFLGPEEQLFSFSVEDAIVDDLPSETGEGGWFVEEALDASFGKRRDNRRPIDNSIDDAESQEEMERRKVASQRPPGMGGMSFYVYYPDTNRYSSFRVYGVRQSDFTPAQ